MGLKEYNQKRDFTKTEEPKGKAVKNTKNRIFVIQKHAASHLHYDFRLEMDGVLKSWAVPKGPSLDPAIKRLAMHVEDHPLEYGNFEGTIPKGQYGGGSVLLWDSGSWIPDEDPSKGYKTGHLKFTLKGKKLEGRWALIRFGERAGKSKETWLLRKEKDEFASKKDILKARPESIKSGLEIADIGKARALRITKKVKPKKKEKIVLSDRYNFQLATLGDQPPEGPDWIYEIKLDGYRLHAYLEAGRATLFTRNGQNYTKKFPALVSQLKQFPVKTAILDGEVTMLDTEGRSNFQMLQNALSEGDSDEAVFYVFDLLHHNGEDLRSTPLLKRKERLKHLCEGVKVPTIKYCDHFIGEGSEILKHTCKLGLEGIICKRVDSVYHGTRTRDWIKAKCSKRQEFVIAGFTKSTNKSLGFGALLLGFYDDKNRLHYAGKVGTGFTVKSRRLLKKKLKALVTSHSAFSPPLSSSERRGVTWVQPTLVAEINFTEWTRDKRCRHPSFQGLREDKKSKSVSQEKAMPTLSKTNSKNSVKIAGVTLTHPDRPLMPKSQVTKRLLAQFFLDSQKWVLPHYLNRPLVLVRCPGGGKIQCFFQKHATEGFPDSIPRVSVKEDNGEVKEYVTVSSIQHLIALIQLNTVEFHSWGSKADDIEIPDRIVFDLDPSPEVPWKAVVQAARNLKAFLQKFKLESFARTTGGKGLHVVVPIAPRYDWDEVKDLARKAVELFSQNHPGKFTTNMSKAKRKGKIFLDYLRNGRGATSIVAYSPRARDKVPFAVTVGWDELAKVGSTYDLEDVRRRLRGSFKDPWTKIESKKQSLAALAEA